MGICHSKKSVKSKVQVPHPPPETHEAATSPQRPPSARSHPASIAELVDRPSSRWVAEPDVPDDRPIEIDDVSPQMNTTDTLPDPASTKSIFSATSVFSAAAILSDISSQEEGTAPVGLAEDSDPISAARDLDEDLAVQLFELREALFAEKGIVEEEKRSLREERERMAELTNKLEERERELEIKLRTLDSCDSTSAGPSLPDETKKQDGSRTHAPDTSRARADRSEGETVKSKDGPSSSNTSQVNTNTSRRRPLRTRSFDGPKTKQNTDDPSASHESRSADTARQSRPNGWGAANNASSSSTKIPRPRANWSHVRSRLMDPPRQRSEGKYQAPTRAITRGGGPNRSDSNSKHPVGGHTARNGVSSAGQLRTRSTPRQRVTSKHSSEELRAEVIPRTKTRIPVKQPPMRKRTNKDPSRDWEDTTNRVKAEMAGTINDVYRTQRRVNGNFSPGGPLSPTMPSSPVRGHAPVDLIFDDALAVDGEETGRLVHNTRDLSGLSRSMGHLPRPQTSTYPTPSAPLPALAAAAALAALHSKTANGTHDVSAALKGSATASDDDDDVGGYDANGSLHQYAAGGSADDARVDDAGFETPRRRMDPRHRSISAPDLSPRTFQTSTPGAPLPSAVKELVGDIDARILDFTEFDIDKDFEMMEAACKVPDEQFFDVIKQWRDKETTVLDKETTMQGKSARAFAQADMMMENSLAPALDGTNMDYYAAAS
eukprot:Rmarinus@m.9844